MTNPLTSRSASLIIVLAVSFAVYANSLGNGFVYDDTEILQNNPWIGDLSLIPKLFTTDVWAYKGWGTSNYYRPIPLIVLMVDYRLFGADPWGYHLTYVLLNMAVSVMLLFVFTELFNQSRQGRQGQTKGETTATRRWSPLAAALLYATHPVHTEVVAWNGAHEMILTFFALLCLYLHMKGRSALAVAAFVVATFTKETAVIIPVLLLAYDFSFNRPRLFASGAAGMKRLVRTYLPFVVAGTIYMAIRSYAIGGFAPINAHADLTAYELTLGAFTLFSDYLLMLAWPSSLTPNHVFHPPASLMEGRVLFSVAACGAFGAALYISAKKNPLIFFSLALVAVPLLPVMYIPAFGSDVFAERYLYLPSAGYAIILTVLLTKAARWLPTPERRAAATFAAVAAITVAFAAATIARNPVWRDEMSLWTDTVVKSPESHIARNNLGKALKAAGRTEEAKAEYARAIEIMPAYGKAHYNLANIYMDEGKTAMAIIGFQKAAAFNPKLFEIHYNLGLAYAKASLFDMAAASYNEALKIAPASADTHNNLGLALYSLGRLNEAVGEFEEAVSLAPSLAEAHYNLGIAYGDMGETDKAYEEMKKAMGMSPELEKGFR